MSTLFSNRVKSVIEECELPTDLATINSVVKLLKWQPTARDVRIEGKCDVCKELPLLSYIHPDDIGTHGTDENCGYYCSRCGFSNAGSRPIAKDTQP